VELTRFRELSPSIRRSHEIDEWSARLQSVCGNFQSRLCEDVSRVTGKVQLSEAAGLELVQVANDLVVVSRDHRDIRTDYGEHLFCCSSSSVNTDPKMGLTWFAPAQPGGRNVESLFTLCAVDVGSKG
jgi:hypothetical protein